jgi:uncharacterized protein YbjT (DUF2867 family)
VRGDALRAETFASEVPADATVVHLVGTSRPNPTKAAEFRAVDLASIHATVTAVARRIRHLIYVSVAQPAPVMRAYIAVRQEGETLVRTAGVPATIIRPWYILGPGHRWPVVLLPLYAVLRMMPAYRAGAERLGLVTLRQMVAAMVRAVAEPPDGIRIVEVPEIRGS